MSTSSYCRLINLDCTENTESDDLFEGLLPRKGLVTLLGESGTGKTLLALRLAACLSTHNAVAQFKEGSYALPFVHAITLLKGSTLYVAGEGVLKIGDRIHAAKYSLPKQDIAALPNGCSPSGLMRPFKGLA